MVLHGNGHSVRVWSPFSDYAESVSRDRENARYLPGVRIPEGIRWTANRGEAAEECDLVVAAMPTKYFRDVVGGFRGLVPSGCLSVSVAKGLDAGTHKRMSEVADEVLGISGTAALSGPSHAEEVARQMPAAVTVAATDPDIAAAIQTAFSTVRFRVYTSTDVIGVELGGALKNIIAVAAGVSDGLGFGDNARAALMTRGLAEITRFGCALGARADTFAGLSGMGDLIVTCSSRHSRNRAVGERIGRGEPVASILAGMTQAAEGVWNCAQAVEMAGERDVDMPITTEVHAMVHLGKPPRDSVRDILDRDFKPE
jgi:glycerol-3-phosphate dehydrogenase (NAD(P)+)